MSASKHRVYHRLQLAAHRLRKKADRALGDAVGLTTAQAAVLAVLDRSGGVSQRTIARELGLNESALTPMIARLVRMELVDRVRDETDVRAWRLELSPTGREVLEATKAPFGTVNAVLDRELDEAEIERLVVYLNRIVDALE